MTPTPEVTAAEAVRSTARPLGRRCRPRPWPAPLGRYDDAISELEAGDLSRATVTGRRPNGSNLRPWLARHGQGRGDPGALHGAGSPGHRRLRRRRSTPRDVQRLVADDDVWPGLERAVDQRPTRTPWAASGPAASTCYGTISGSWRWLAASAASRQSISRNPKDLDEFSGSHPSPAVTVGMEFKEEGS